MPQANPPTHHPLNRLPKVSWVPDPWRVLSHPRALRKSDRDVGLRGRGILGSVNMRAQLEV